MSALAAELQEALDRAAKERLSFANQMSATFFIGDVRWSADCYPFFDGKILLGLHKKWKRWMCPGGKMQPGEQPADAARRELREETGIEACVFPQLPGAASDAPPGLLQFRDIREGGKRFLTFGFLALVTAFEVKGNGEFEELRWVTLEEARTLDIHPGCLALIEQVFRLFTTVDGEFDPTESVVMSFDDIEHVLGTDLLDEKCDRATRIVHSIDALRARGEKG